MTTYKCLGRVLVFSALVAGATSASAQDSGFYLGLDAGVAVYPDNLQLTVDKATLFSPDKHTTGAAWAFSTGYQFNKLFALELAYVDLAPSSTPFSNTSGANSAQVDHTFEARGARLAAVGTLPLGNWEPYLKLGALRARRDASTSGIVGTTPVGFEKHAASTSAFVALGARYRFSNHWDAGLELAQYGAIGDAEVTGARQASTATLGVAYHF
jgi:OmpA-OmpF porin, OOP family